jgi:putative ABC transport system permease protein
LVLGGAIFIAVLSVYSSLMATLDEALAYWNYDLDISLARVYRTEQIMDVASAIPGVTVVETWSGGGARRVRPDGTESGNIRLLAPPATTQMINPRLLEGRWLLPDDENAIVLNSAVLEDESDLQVGQSVRLNVAGRENDWRIVGIVQGVLTGPIAYVNYPYFARETRMVGRAGQVQLALAQHDGAYQREMATRVKAAFEAGGLDVVSADTNDSIRETMVLQFNLLVTFLTIMAVLIAVVGALGLTGTMSINVLERSREVGVMRAIGATDSSVLNIFLTEGLLIGFISWALGGILSLPISQILSHTVGLAFLDAPLTYTFSTMGAGLWLFLVLLLAALSSWWPSWRASRLTVRDVLAYE